MAGESESVHASWCVGGVDNRRVTRRTAAFGALISALLLVIVLMLLMWSRPDVPLLWASLVFPTAAAVWFLRQAVMPDEGSPRSWRVRNALGCLCVGMGLPVVLMVAGGDSLFGASGPDSYDRQGLGILVLLGILAGLGGVITLAWGAISWSLSVARAT
jgi:hypothetical protein